MTSKINKSWERTRSETHSPQGIDALRKSLKDALVRKYTGMAESMFRYEGLDDGVFEDMNVMSQNTMPEVTLMRNGKLVQFMYEGRMHMLPLTYDSGGINIYGKISSWHPVPVGWDDTLRGSNPVVDRIRDMSLDATNSVVWKNDLYGTSDQTFIESMVNTLVDNVLTMNQLQLISKMPFVFNVTEDNLLTAKNYFLAICEDRPVIFTNLEGDRPVPVVEPSGVRIDPALFEIFDRFECLILEQLGFPCVPITKRAQQTMSEVQSNDEKIRMRRMERLNQRQCACDRSNELFGTHLRCISIIDEDIMTTDVNANGFADDKANDAEPEVS